MLNNKRGGLGEQERLQAATRAAVPKASSIRSTSDVVVLSKCAGSVEGAEWSLAEGAVKW